MEYVGTKYFEDIRDGEVYTADETYLVTQDEIIEVGTRWDPQAFHTDVAAAADSIFGGLVASSVHLFAIYVRLGSHVSTPLVALTALGFSDVQLHAPARPGDRLSLRIRHEARRLSQSRPDCGIVDSHGELLNQERDLVFSVSSSALVRRRSPAPELA